MNTQPRKALAIASLVIASGLGLPGIASAELSATALPGDARLVQFEYDADNTFLVLVRPKSVTHVEFAPDEQVVTVAAGDTKNFETTPTANKHHLFVKPLFDAMETSMTVITTKRTYQFVIRSTGAGSKWYQRVTWRYGQTLLMDAKAQEEREIEDARKAERAAEQEASVTLATDIKPENLRFGYHITGDAPFKPASVFDDGKFTWIRMPQNLTELPALFASSKGGELAIVNYVIKGDYMLAQRLMEEGVLKLDKEEVRFSRKTSRGFFGGYGGN